MNRAHWLVATCLLGSSSIFAQEPGQGVVPRHAAGLVSVWEREGVQRVGLELYYTGVQPLGDNPYLENLGTVRMTKYQRLVRPARGEGGRWTTDAWGPLEGRTINGGVRVIG